MYSRAYSRQGVFAWSPPGVDSNGLIVADFAQHFDPTSTTVASCLDFLPLSSIYSSSSASALTPSVSVSTSYRFNELSWSVSTNSPFPLGILAGGTENGTVVFIDAQSIISKSQPKVLSAQRVHQGHVLSVCHSQDSRWLLSGGGSGQLLLWDLNNFSIFSPGKSNYPDQIKMVRFNKKAEQIAACISSHRCSVYDMRRPGAPILEFGELGSGCDWSGLSWNPSDASSLVLCSQSDALPLVQRWDLRFPTAPLKDLRLHQKGVSAIDWHDADPRMLLTASHDGQILISNPDTAETIGTVGCEQGDWIRSVAWSRAKPHLLAIQYFQHPLQISSIEPLVASEGESVSSHNVQLNIVPAWVGAAPVGVSFALGGKMAVYSKQWDDATQAWQFNVELRKVPTDPNFDAPIKELIAACDNNQLTEYCNNRAMAVGSEEERLLWKFLALRKDTDSNPDYTDFIELLGIQLPLTPNAQPQHSNHSLVATEATSNKAGEGNTITHTTTRTDSSTSASSNEGFEDVFPNQPHIDWDHLDVHSWQLVDGLIARNDESLVNSLLEKKDYASAFVYTYSRPKLFRLALQAYLSENLPASSRIIAYADSNEGIKNLLLSCPNKEWKRKLALLLSRHHSVKRAAHSLSNEWIQESEGLVSALPAVVCGDVDLLLQANSSLDLDIRILQAVALRVALNYSRGISKGHDLYPKVLHEYVLQLVANGDLEVAFRLMRSVDTEDHEFCSLRYAIYESLGGYSGTQCKAPPLPAISQEEAELISTLRAGHRSHQPNVASFVPRGYASVTSFSPSPFTPPPTSSNFAFGMPPPAQANYQNQYQAANFAPLPPIQQSMPNQPTPPLSMGPTSFPAQPPSYVPPSPSVMQYQLNSMTQQFASMPDANGYMQQLSSIPLQSAPSTTPMPSLPKRAVSTGWNDPPPIERTTQTPKSANVMQVQFNPGNVQQQQQQTGAPSGQWNQPSISQLPVSAYAATSTSPSSLSTPTPEAQLSIEDQPIKDKLSEILAAIQAANPQPAILTKVSDAQRRLGAELYPRLSVGKLSLQTRHFLHQYADLMTRGEFRAAQLTTGQMVRVGGDFVEISSFLPALKTLCSVAQQTFGQR